MDILSPLASTRWASLGSRWTTTSCHPATRQQPELAPRNTLWSDCNYTLNHRLITVVRPCWWLSSTPCVRFANHPTFRGELALDVARTGRAPCFNYTIVRPTLADRLEDVRIVLCEHTTQNSTELSRRSRSASIWWIRLGWLGGSSSTVAGSSTRAMCTTGDERFYWSSQIQSPFP